MGVHAAQMPQQAQQRDLASRQAGDVVEIHDPQPLLAPAGHQPAVQRAVALGDRGPGEALGVAARRGPCGQRSARRRPQPRAERLAVAGGDHQRGVERRRGLWQAADVADDAGRAARRRLQHHQPEALDRDARHRRHVGAAVGLDQLLVGDPAHHAHPAGEGWLRGARRHRLAQRPVADQQQLRAGRQLALNPAPRVEQHLDPHARHHAAGAHHDERGGVDPQPRARPRPVAGGEAIECHARCPHADVPRRHAVALDEHSAEGAGQHHVGVRAPQHTTFQGSAQRALHTRCVPRRGVLLRPRPVEVEHRRAPPRAEQERGRRVQREVGVHHLGAARGAPGGQPERAEAAREREVVARRGGDRRGRARGGADHHAARLGKLLEERAVVAVEPAHRRGKPAHPEHQHAGVAVGWLHRTSVGCGWPPAVNI